MALLRCAICHFDFELDDVMQDLHNGSCLCLKCYERTTNTEKRMSKELQQQLTDVLRDVPNA